MIDQLELVALHRRSEADPPKRERHTFDFVVNGVSLFTATQASASDMCGCLSDPRFEPDLASRLNVKAASMLTLDGQAEVGHRAVLYCCPNVATSLVGPSRSLSLGPKIPFSGLSLHTRTGLNLNLKQAT